MPNSKPPRTITRATRRVLEELVVAGDSDKEIAERLICTPQTVKFHMWNARQISGARNRTELALWWIRKGRYEYS